MISGSNIPNQSRIVFGYFSDPKIPTKRKVIVALTGVISFLLLLTLFTWLIDYTVNYPNSKFPWQKF